MTKSGRRIFIKTNALAAAGLIISGTGINVSDYPAGKYPIRLGGPVAGKFSDPAEWIKAHKALGYSAAYCPVQPGAPAGLIKAYRREAGKNNIIIAEVGAWNNMMDPDENKRKENILKNINALRLADEIGAICCVNISGAKGAKWDGPYAENYVDETFGQIVETVRYVIDQVKPVNAFFCLEPMPYMLPDSPDTYLELIKAIDRKQFGAHLDVVNMISSPQRYFNNGAFIRECFSKLGPHIKSIHAKDILIMPELTVHLEERRPGEGTLDYALFLKETCKLKDVPFMLEHLKTQEEYKLAADYVRSMGRKERIEFAE